MSEIVGRTSQACNKKVQSGTHAVTCVGENNSFQIMTSSTHAPAENNRLASKFRVPVKHPLAQATKVCAATLGWDAVARWGEHVKTEIWFGLQMVKQRAVHRREHRANERDSA